MRMKLKNKDDEEVEMDPEDTKAAKGSKGGDKKKLQISEMDEWMDSDDMSSSEEEGEEKKKREDEDSDNDSKAKQKKAKQQQSKKKRKKKVEDDEAFEVSLKVPEKKTFLIVRHELILGIGWRRWRGIGKRLHFGFER